MVSQVMLLLSKTYAALVFSRPLSPLDGMREYRDILPSGKVKYIKKNILNYYYFFICRLILVTFFK